jgi:hypothetical protein
VLADVVRVVERRHQQERLVARRAQKLDRRRRERVVVELGDALEREAVLHCDTRDVPLAAVGAVVSGAGKKMAERLLAVRLRNRLVVVYGAQRVRHASGEQGGAGRRTQRKRRVGAGEARPARGERVQRGQVGRGNVGVAGTTARG